MAEGAHVEWCCQCCNDLSWEGECMRVRVCTGELVHHECEFACVFIWSGEEGSCGRLSVENVCVHDVNPSCMLNSFSDACVSVCVCSKESVFSLHRGFFISQQGCKALSRKQACVPTSTCITVFPRRLQRTCKADGVIKTLCNELAQWWTFDHVEGKKACAAGCFHITVDQNKCTLLFVFITKTPAQHNNMCEIQHTIIQNKLFLSRSSIKLCYLP